jgi:hypothetical protein
LECLNFCSHYSCLLAIGCCWQTASDDSRAAMSHNQYIEYECTAMSFQPLQCYLLQSYVERPNIQYVRSVRIAE